MRGEKKPNTSIHIKELNIFIRTQLHLKFTKMHGAHYITKIYSTYYR